MRLLLTSPAALFAGLVSLAGTAQASLSNRTVQAVSPAQPVNITLTYPRSEAYNTFGRMPIVFSISNPQYAAWLNPRIDFAIAKYGGSYPFEGECPVYADTRNFTVDLSKVNLTDSATVADPLFVYAFWECLDYQEGEWHFSWSVRTGRAPDNATDFNYDNNVTDSGAFIFATVHGGGRTIDLVENTSDESCNQVPYLHEFQVSGIAEGSCSGSITERPGCAVVANDTALSIAASDPGPAAGLICGGAAVNASAAKIINDTPRFMGSCPVLPIAHVGCAPSLTVKDMHGASLPSETLKSTKSAAMPRMSPGSGAVAVAVVLSMALGVALF